MYSRKHIDTIAYVKQHLRLAGLTMLLSITVVLLLVAKIVYGHLGSLPQFSVAVILWMLIVISASVYGLAQMTTQRAISSIDKYRDKLDMLLYTSRDIHTVHTVELNNTLMDRILDAAFTITGADAAAFIVAEKNALQFKTVRGPNADKIKDRSFPVVSGVIEDTLRSANPITLDLINEDDGYRNILYRETATDVKSVLCIPVTWGGKTIGALVLAKTEAGHFLKDDEELLQFFITQSLISRKNAEHQEAMKDLELHLMDFLVEAVERIWGKSGHAKKVAQYALKIGRTLSLDETAIQRLHDAAMLHDIGLLRCDRTGYHAHPMYGHQLLGRIAFYREIAPIVLHHHERFDGSGYPAHLKGEQIPVLSRVLGIAEAFDVMTNPQSFRNAGEGRAMSMAEAIEELERKSGSQFDPRLVGLFSDVLTQEEVVGNVQ